MFLPGIDSTAAVFGATASERPHFSVSVPALHLQPSQLHE